LEGAVMMDPGPYFEREFRKLFVIVLVLIALAFGFGYALGRWS
jgi:hypothetical protein